MTPKDLDDALKNLARTFVREVKQQDVPLRVSRERAVDIIRTKKYQHRDEISLILEARDYIKGRLPVRDRATAVAILLQRDAVLVESPDVPRQTLLPKTSSIKAEAELSRMYDLDDPRSAAPRRE
jgi:hypothetical protein